jgi:hypothetical protein
MKDKVEQVYFKLGDGAGKLIIDIAREHLFYNLNPDKSVKSLTNTLRGVTHEVVLDIISGKKILLVADERYIDCVDYVEELHKEKFPPFDIYSWVERKLQQIIDVSEEWQKAISELKRIIVKNDGEFIISVKYEKLLSFFYEGNSENLIDVDDDTLGSIKGLTLGIRNFISESMKTMQVIKWLCHNYYGLPNDFSSIPIQLLQLHTTFTELMLKNSEIELTLRRNLVTSLMLDKHLEAQLEIDKATKNIKPVNILDGYTAGWLSPSGEYYGLNGEISNMLHNQIADALLVAGVIPIGKPTYDRAIDNRTNPDRWLEENGWAKIHGDWILYDGWNRGALPDGVITPMTKEQHDAIEKYGKICCDGKLYLGYNKQFMTAARFGMTEIPMLKIYFE